MTEKPGLKVVADAPTPTPNATPTDALDIESLWMDPELGDGLTCTTWHSIPIGKPKDFFRVHPDPAYRRRAEIYAHKVDGQIETSYYVLGPNMKGRIDEARPCVLVTCIYRDGALRIWPIMFPRDGERDNAAWVSARSAARTAIDKWVKAVWLKTAYKTKDAMPGYAPDPDLTKIPPFNELIEIALGQHGIIQNTEHAIYRELLGAPARGNDDDDGL